jgi:hypothetical protein
LRNFNGTSCGAELVMSLNFILSVGKDEYSVFFKRFGD